MRWCAAGVFSTPMISSAIATAPVIWFMRASRFALPSPRRMTITPGKRTAGDSTPPDGGRFLPRNETHNQEAQERLSEHAEQIKNMLGYATYPLQT